MNYLIGQRVIVNNSEIGTVVKDFGDEVWIILSSKSYASGYDRCNVRPLPNGQM